nr:carotenoid biosynthesis protein [Anaerolineae bacterium]
MTYFGFLVLFLGPPLLIIALLTWRDQVRRRSIPADFRNWAPWFAIVAHVVAALLYTTPWDNYLVATGVWYYTPDLVSGIVLGWV